jgi:hypothetical protein
VCKLKPAIEFLCNPFRTTNRALAFGQSLCVVARTQFWVALRAAGRIFEANDRHSHLQPMEVPETTIALEKVHAIGEQCLCP